MNNDNVSRRLAEDYVRYSIKNNGLAWHNGPNNVVDPDDLQRAMRALGDEFVKMSDEKINWQKLRVNHETFKATAGEICSDGVNWGRVMALFVFGGKFAVLCVQRGMPQLVDSVVDWLSDYVEQNLQQWIAANGGWTGGFLEFYEGGPESRSKDQWPSLKKICSYAAAGLGILTLGAFLSQRT